MCPGLFILKQNLTQYILKLNIINKFRLHDAFNETKPSNH